MRGTLIAASDTLFAMQEHTRVRVGLHDARPLAFRDKTGAARGFVVDLLGFVAAQEGWDVVYVHGTWSECLARLRGGEIDLLFPVTREPGE